MGYKIVYSKHPAKKKRNIRLPIFVALFFVLFLAVVHIWFSETVEQVRSIIISETWRAGVQAFVAMVEDLSAGERVTDAVEAFCQEVFGEQ